MRARLLAGVAALAVAAGALLLLQGGSSVRRAGRPSGRAGFEVALQDNPVFVQRAYFDRQRAFALARRLGVSWLRATVLWYRAVRPGGWRRLDDLVAAAAARGIRVELTLTGPAPADVTGDRQVGVFRPDPRRFAQFAADAARHFRGRVTRYSVWNEPNFSAWLRPSAEAPALYRALYAAAFAAITAADPAARVLIGETAGAAPPGQVIPVLRFLRALACRDASGRPTASCAPLVADGFADHPYDFARAPEDRPAGADTVTLGSLDRLTGALDDLARAGALRDRAGRPLDVYLTEFGYFERGPQALPSETRAAYLRRAFERAASRYPRVRQLLQYLLVEPPPGFPGGEFDTALVTRAGGATPAFDTLAAWARANAARLERPAPGAARARSVGSR